MKRNTVYLPVVLLACLMVQSCKQDYPEGPELSLRSAEARVEGSKHIESYVVNGIDSTFMFDSLFANTTYPTKGFYFGAGLSDNIIVCEPCSGGIWSFSLDGRRIGLNFPASLIGRFGLNQAYDILRLSEQDLWVRYKGQGRTVEIKFKKL